MQDALQILALAQETASGERIGLRGLFIKSLDVFTVLLITGSVAAVALIVRSALDIRTSKILPDSSVERADLLLTEDRIGELRNFAQGDKTFVGAVLRPALEAGPHGREAVREAADIAASEETARWFRKIEPLQLIGNLGPLVGLAGTVWGMILAFTSLSETGGQAGPADLSLGISKALFHTLMGLMLAIPCLLVFGIYRAAVDRICTRGISVTARLIERLPAEPHHPSQSGRADRAA
ncbi:MAG: MotA/TolQ/ExbB proton channel family protein [Planctomycetota bacterium]